MKIFPEFFKPLGLLNWLLAPLVVHIEPATAILIAGALGAGGGLLGGRSTASAQREANRINAAIAAQQSRDAYNNWLVSRGVSTGQDGLPHAGTPVNTALPLWSTIGGMPSEQFLLNAILERSGLSNSVYGRPDAPLNLSGATTLGSDDDAYQSMTRAYVQAGSPGAGGSDPYSNSWNDAFNAWTDKLMRISGAESWGGVRAPLLGMSPGQLDQLAQIAATGGPDAVQAFINEQAAGGGPDGAASLTAVDPRLQGLQDQAIASAESIFDGTYLNQEMGALAPVLSARSNAAELQRARNDELRARIEDLYGAERGAAKGVYDAQLLSADAYGSGALEAVNRILSQNEARRRVRGFSGGGSFDDLSRSRTLAPALTQGAIARTAAGENYARAIGSTDVARATRRGQVLDADADIAKQNAELQNALDRLRLVSSDITRRTSSMGAPGALSTQGVRLRSDAADSAFADLDATMRRLGLFSSNNATPPTPTYAPVQPVVGNGQIFGSALQSIGQMGMDYWTTQSLINSLKAPAGGTLNGIPVVNTPATATVLSSPSF